jgi:hypothetical protein
VYVPDIKSNNNLSPSKVVSELSSMVIEVFVRLKDREH